MAKRIENQFLHDRLVAGERVAGAGVVDQPSGGLARGGSRRGCRGRAATASGRTVALAGVVEDEVENDADAGLMQRRNRFAAVRPARPAPAAGRAP